MVNMNWDDLFYFYWVSEVMCYFDFVWMIVCENVSVINFYGVKKLMVMLFVVNLYFFKFVDVEEKWVVGFVGSCYGVWVRNFCILV